MDLRLKIPPVAVFLLAFLGMRLLTMATPFLNLRVPGQGVLAMLLSVAGIIVAVLGVVAFHRVRTTVNPMHPDDASSLVVNGIYRYSRNPMYLGMVLVLLGWGLWLGNPLALLLVVGFMIYMSRYQIIPEEQALIARFPQQAEGYLSRVRRWL